MSYGDARHIVQLQKLDVRISEFVTRFYQKGAAKNRPLVFLFPGGLGSRLLRGITPHGSGEFFSHYTAWIDEMFILSEVVQASDLQMQGDVDNLRHLVVPDGTIDFLKFKPYYDFTRWCEANKLDWFAFSWDWRRSLEPTVDFFLNTFLGRFRQRVRDLCNYDPLENFSLIGHSFGGLLIKLMLNRHSNPYVRQMNRAITVGSPFYGYGGQIHRYFAGVEQINAFKGKINVIRAGSSMRGPYALMFLDHDAFLRVGGDLANDTRYPLPGYPVMDNDDPTREADPYNPLTNGGKIRYPKSYLFNRKHLAAGKATSRDVMARLDPSVEHKLFNIRFVQHEDGQDLQNTIVRQTWKWITPKFNPEEEDTPVTNFNGPGDSTIPAWSARLISTPESNVRTVKGRIPSRTILDDDHMLLMDDPLIHDELAKIMELEAPVKIRPRPARAASPAKLKTFMAGMHTAPAVLAAASDADRRIAVSKHFAQYSREEHELLLARIYLDALKPPPQTHRPVPPAPTGRVQPADKQPE